MIIRAAIFLLALCFLSLGANAQQISFKDTIAAYNLHKAHINKTGMAVLGSWGLVNIAAGGIGYFTAKQDETKYFSEMSMAWGVVNTGIAGLTMRAMKRELALKTNSEGYYRSYLTNKRIYLINAGLDVVYIGAGVGLTAYAHQSKRNQDIYSGFGKAVVVQGIFLLLFDNIMFSAHQMDNSNWYRIMNEIRFTNRTIGIEHTF